MTREEAICGLEDMLMSKLDGRNNLELYEEEIPVMLEQDIEALKLAIEALQERPKGRWIELPCEVGDTVWALNRNEIHETKVFSMKLESENDHWIYMIKCKILDGFPMFRPFLFGKTVFLTKEEAEKALKGE